MADQPTAGIRSSARDIKVIAKWDALMVIVHITQDAENVRKWNLQRSVPRECNKVSRFEIGDRVEIVGEIASNFQSKIGVVTAIEKEFCGTKFTVRLADGTESVFWDSRLKIPPVIFADMIFDTHVSPGLELCGSTPEHHMRFICREFDIHVKLTGSEELKSMYGRVTANGVAPGSSLITLLFDSEPYATTATDSLGEFKLDQIPSGRATLEVVVPSHRIVATFHARSRLDGAASLSIEGADY